MNLLYLLAAIKPDNSVEFTATVVIAGLGIVLGTLALLIVVFNIFGKIMQRSQKKKAKQKVVTTNDERKYPDISEMEVEELPLPAENGAVGGEIVAAITAAIYMIEGGGAKIKSIKPATPKKSSRGERKAWAQSAVDYNTRPF